MDEYERIRRLRDEYEAALDDAERLRDAYHREIVKAHRSGRSLREIAEGLGISHQRVHQIVSPAGASKPRQGRGMLGAGAGAAVLLLVGAALVVGRSWPGREPLVRATPVGRPSSEVVVMFRCGRPGKPGANSLKVAAAFAACQRKLGRLAVGNAAVLVIDPETGAIRAMAWGPFPRSVPLAIDLLQRS